MCDTTERPVRKTTRLKEYDYSQPGYYFVTICTKERKNLLWKVVGAIIDRPENVPLSNIGKITRRQIAAIHQHYPAVWVDHYVIMPNHIHLLLVIDADPSGRSMIAPTISTVVRMMKDAISKEVGQSIWQRSFFDHVIRNEKDYQRIWQYIENNPLKWTDDCFFAP